MPAPAVDRTPSLTPAQKVIEAMFLSDEFVPGAVGEQLKQLLTLQNAAILAASVVAWAVSQAFGIGEIFDAIMLVVAAGSIGVTAAWEGGGELVAFMKTAVRAKTNADIERAARHFARARVILGMSVIEAVLLRGRGRVVARRGMPTPKPQLRAEEPPPYGTKPIVKYGSHLPEGTLGTTYDYGDIYISNRVKPSQEQAVLLHEIVHRYFSPRTGLFRRLRAGVAKSARARSEILVYLEEALAQGFSVLRREGLLKAIDSLDFPLGAKTSDGEIVSGTSYVTMSRLKYEGHVIGSVVLQGETFLVAIGNGHRPEQ